MSQPLLYEAPLELFRSPIPQILWGDLLEDVKRLSRSILKDGLLNPLTTAEDETHLVVIDGRKRLAALRRLQFASRLPTELETIPYMPFEKKCAQSKSLRSDKLSLLDNAEQYFRVKAARRSGRTVFQIAEDLYCTSVYTVSYTHLTLPTILLV